MKNITIFDYLKQLEAAVILAQVARQHGHTIDLLKSNRRGCQLPIARQEAMRRLRFELQLSYPAIGKILNKDHSTVMHAIKKREQKSPAGSIAPVFKTGMSAAATANPLLQGSGRDNFQEVKNGR